MSNHHKTFKRTQIKGSEHTGDSKDQEKLSEMLFLSSEREEKSEYICGGRIDGIIKGTEKILVNAKFLGRRRNSLYRKWKKGDL